MVVDALHDAIHGVRMAGEDVDSIHVAPRTFIRVKMNLDDELFHSGPTPWVSAYGLNIVVDKNIEEGVAVFFDMAGAAVARAQILSPYDLITRVEEVVENRWSAFDEGGSFLMELTEVGALKVLTRLRR